MNKPLKFVRVDPARMAMELLALPEAERAQVAVTIWMELARGEALHPIAVALAQEADEYLNRKREAGRHGGLAKAAKEEAQASSAIAVLGSAIAQPSKGYPLHCIALHEIQNSNNCAKSPPAPPEGGSVGDWVPDVEIPDPPVQATPPSPAPRPPSELELAFDAARKAFPGRCGGLKSEWDHFKRKWGKETASIVPLLLPAVRAEEGWRETERKRGAFVPDWKNFTTWINRRCWEQELKPSPATFQPKAQPTFTPPRLRAL